MTKEQAIEHLYDITTDVLYRVTTEEKEALDMAIKALEQQPSDDEITITMKKGTLKYSGHGYVVYNKDWFRKHFATEVAIMTGYNGYIEQPIENTSPVTMEINTGRRNGKTYEYYSKTMYKDKSLLEWAIIWLKTSNDAFFEEYGFNFNPHEYKGLYELVMKCRDGLHIGAVNCTQNLTTMAAQLQSGLNGLQYGV